MNNVKTRTWKGYFIEFIMLFLAVSLGFMADNFREKISERTKEKEYILSMVEDVKEDERNIEEVIKINSQRVEHLDSFLKKCFSYNSTNKEKMELNHYFSQVLIHPDFITPLKPMNGNDSVKF